MQRKKSFSIPNFLARLACANSILYLLHQERSNNSLLLWYVFYPLISGILKQNARRKENTANMFTKQEKTRKVMRKSPFASYALLRMTNSIYILEV